MKIAFVVGTLVVRNGGPALDTLILARHLRTQFGHETVVVTWKLEGEYFPTDNIDVIELPETHNLITWPSMLRRLAEILARQDAVFVSGIWSPSDGLAMRLCWPARVPVFIRTCGMLEPYILANNPVRKRVGRLLFANRNLRRASGIIVASEPEASRVAALGFGKNIRIIRNGVPPQTTNLTDGGVARRALSLDPGIRTLLYLGRIHPKKGLHILLQALREVMASDGPRALLVVAGPWSDSTYQSQIESLASKPELRGLVRFLGEVSGDSKENAFSATDLFVLPSKSEGLPNAVLEALSRGIPCIVTPGCNLPEVPKYGAGIAVEATVEGMVTALRWSLEDGLDLRILRQNAKRLSMEVFNIEQSFAAYHALVCETKAHRQAHN